MNSMDLSVRTSRGLGAIYEQQQQRIYQNNMLEILREKHLRQNRDPDHLRDWHSKLQQFENNLPQIQQSNVAHQQNVVQKEIEYSCLGKKRRREDSVFFSESQGHSSENNKRPCFYSEGNSATPGYNQTIHNMYNL